MTKLRYYIYEIVSAAIGLAAIAFFGTIALLPFEIGMFGEDQTIFWMFIILGLSVILAFLLLSFFKRKDHGFIMRIVNVMTVITALLMVFAFLFFTQDLFEPWLIQMGWFMRYNGHIVGLFVGTLTIKTIIGISELITKFNSGKDLANPQDMEGTQLDVKVITLSTVSLGFIFYSAEMLFFRYYSLFITLLILFIVEAGLIIYAVGTLLFPNYYDEFSWNNSEIGLENLSTEEKGGNPSENPGTMKLKGIKGKISGISKKVRDAGSDPSIFWYLFVPLLVILILSIVSAILYPLNIVYLISIRLGINLLYYNIPLVQIITLLIVLLLFFIVVFNAWGGRMNRRLGKFFKSKVKKFFAVSSFGAIDIMRVLGLLFVFSQILYFYDYPLFLPPVISSFLLFGVLGAVIYFFVARFQIPKKIVYYIAILLLFLNFYLIYIDGIANGFNISGGDFDLIFPFTYLHSLPNFAIVGIPLGFIVSDLLLSLAFTHTDGIDAPNRAVSIGVVPFVLGMLLIIGNYLVGTPGGDPGGEGFNSFFIYFCLILGGIVLLGFAFNYLVTELILPTFEKESKIKLKKTSNNSYKKIKSQKNIKSASHPRRKIVAISLAGLMVLSFIGGFSILTTYSQTYNRPIICMNSGNYYVWIQNSSERVSRNVFVDQGSPQISAISMNLAKNEYGAIQLVWHPFKPVQSVSYVISDFYHQNGSSVIDSGNCTLRFVDYILENEFPDVLIPFTSLDLSVKQNNVFWFAIRTPYNATEGLYEGNLTFSFTGGTEIIQFEVNVWNFTIPNMKHLRTNIGGSSTNLNRTNNFVAHRINDYGVGISKASSLSQLNTVETYTSYLDTSTNTWTFNWTWWDAQIQSKLDKGMNAFRIDYPIPRNPPIEDAIWMLRLKTWFGNVSEHLEFKGWLNYSFYYFIDEYNVFIPEGLTITEYFARLEFLLQELKNASSKFKIMTTAPPVEELEDYIDIFCPISNDRDKEKWDELLAEDYEFWFYSCVGPMAPWPNAHLYNRLYEIRIEMWQVWLYNIHGFLFWRADAYYHGYYSLGFNGWGDGFFLYFNWSGSGVIYDSIRWENFLEGQEDYEFLWLLNATLQYLDDNPGLISAGELAAYRAELNNIVDAVVGERMLYCDRVNTLYSGRDRIGSILNDLASVVNLTALGEAQWLPPHRPGA